MSTTIAALYVETDGTYYGLPSVNPWDAERDAREYGGPHPVVAHPPCERWGRYWHGGPSASVRRILGHDRGMFAQALWAVRTFGGVLEHPEASHAWGYYGLERPPKRGGWVTADAFGGSTCCVEQGHYGHPARKATWLYAVRCELVSLIWGPAQPGRRLDRGYHSAEERRRLRPFEQPTKRLTKRECVETPVPFRDLLISLARSAQEHGQ